MESTNKNLTAQESLEIITNMIDQAKGNVKDTSPHFLFWGWIIVVANLAMFILTQIKYPMPYLAWLVVIPGWLYTIYIASTRGKHQGKTLTHLDRITTALWLSFAVIAFTLVVFGRTVNFQVNPLILLFTSLATFTTGIVLKFKPLIIGGILFWLFAIINFLVPIEYQGLVGAIAFAGGYLVPGYMLKGKSDN